MKVLFWVFITFSVMSAQDTSYFYFGKTYGSEGNFNPLNFILNCGYDNFQVMDNRSLFNQEYKAGFNNVMVNLRDPFPPIRTYGTSNFLKDEIFPSSLKKKHAQWVPNYKLHLLGGGMSYRMMSEWYAYNNVPYPKTLSFVTMAASWFINESMENGTYKGVNVDPIADMYVFNLGGVLLFSFDNICNFFSNDLHLSDWSLQPSINLQNGSLYNNGQYYNLRWKIPFWEHWYIFEVFGYNGVFGLTYKTDAGKALSVGYGLNVSALEVIDVALNKKTARVVDCVGVYYDINGSLMTSILYSASTNNKIVFKMYPGMVSFEGISPGCWVVMNKDNSFTWGISTRYCPGLAFK